MTDSGAGFQMPDLGGLLDGLQKMQQAQRVVLEGHSGGGAVTIAANGSLEFQSVRIDPTAVDPSDVSMLEDLVLAALHDLVRQINETQQGVLGNLDLGGIGGLLGGGPEALEAEEE